MTDDLTLLVTWEDWYGWQEERYDLYAWNQASFWTNLEYRRFTMIHLEEGNQAEFGKDRVLVWKCPIDYPDAENP